MNWQEALSILSEQDLPSPDDIEVSRPLTGEYAVERTYWIGDGRGRAGDPRYYLRIFPPESSRARRDAVEEFTGDIRQLLEYILKHLDEGPGRTDSAVLTYENVIPSVVVSNWLGNQLRALGIPMWSKA